MGRFNASRRAGSTRLGRCGRRAKWSHAVSGRLCATRGGAPALTQAQVAEPGRRVPDMVSHLERGQGARRRSRRGRWSPPRSGEQLVGFLEHAPGANVAAGHRAPAAAERADRDSPRPGGWRALPELRLDQDARWSRSIDVALVRRPTGDAVVVEIWNWFEDVGGALRGLDGKVAALRDHLDPSVEWTIRGLFIVRDTRRNRQLMAELGPMFAARFPGNVARLAQGAHGSGRATAGRGRAALERPSRDER